jgi:hypothetical protein
VASAGKDRVDNVVERRFGREHGPGRSVPESPGSEIEKAGFVPRGKTIPKCADGDGVRGREAPYNMKIASRSGDSGHCCWIVDETVEFSQDLMFRPLRSCRIAVGFRLLLRRNGLPAAFSGPTIGVSRQDNWTS